MGETAVQTIYITKAPWFALYTSVLVALCPLYLILTYVV